jgi:hypothetical protein
VTAVPAYVGVVRVRGVQVNGKASTLQVSGCRAIFHPHMLVSLRGRPLELSLAVDGEGVRSVYVGGEMK